MHNQFNEGGGAEREEEDVKDNYANVVWFPVWMVYVVSVEIEIQCENCNYHRICMRLITVTSRRRD